MASMQQIIVKIMGQDNLSSMLVKIAKSMDNVGKSGKKVSTSFTSSLNQMEKNASKTATQINQSLNQANKIRFKPLSAEFQKATETMGGVSRNTSKNVKIDFEQVNKTKFKPLSTEFQKATETMGTLSKITAADIGNALAHVNNMQFIGLSANFQTAIKGMESASKSAGTGIARDFDQVNRTRFTGIVSSFTSAMSSMGSAAKSTVKGIGSSFEGLSGVMAGVAGGMGVKELFDQAMSRQTTMAVLSNRFGESNAKQFQSIYYDHTKRSSTKDENLDVLAKGIYRLKNIDPESSKRLLRISDALVAGEGTSYDKLELSRSLQALFMGNPKKLKDDMPALYDKLGNAVGRGDTNLMMDLLEKEAIARGAIQTMGGEGLGTTTTGPLGEFNQVLATAESILIEAINVMNIIVHNCLAPFASLLSNINTASGGLVFKLLGFGLVLSTLSMGAGLLINVFGKLAGPVLSPVISGLSKFGSAILNVVSKIPGIGGIIDKLRNIGPTPKMDVTAGTVVVRGLQGGSTPVPSGGGKIPTVEKKGRLAGFGRLAMLGAGAAAAGIAIYALTEGMRRNADTMRGYNDALQNGEKRINELKEASENYKKKVTELTTEKNKLKASGKDVGYIEKEIQDARKKSAQAADNAARAEEALKNAREAHGRINTESTTADTTYADTITQTLRETGRYSAEELDNLDKQNAALKDGTALKQHGLDEKLRIQNEGMAFTKYAVSDQNPRSEAWLKDKEALDGYTKGMDSLAKLEVEFMEADSWIEKVKIGIEQLVTVIQVEWIKAMVILKPYIDPIVGALKQLDKASGGNLSKFAKWAGILVLVAGGLMLVFGGLFKLKDILGSVASRIRRIFGKKHKLDMDCGVCPPGTVVGDQGGGPNKGKGGKGTKGKGRGGRVGRIISRIPGVGRLGNLLGGFGGRLTGIISRVPGLGRLSGIGGRLGGIGGKSGSLLSGGLRGLGGLGRLGGLAAGAARFAGPVGLAITAATAGYGAYQGWTQTKGPWQEKSKGAIGGAVEQLSFGLINKKQVMDGINWLYGQTKGIPGKIGGFLGQVKDRVTKPFVDAWNKAKQAVNKGVANVTNYVKGVPGKIKQGLANVWTTITTPFTNALNAAKTIVNGGIDTVVSAFTALPGKIGDAMKTAYDTVMGWTGQITDNLKKVYCIIMGCSPGIIPAFKKLGREVPRQISKTLPHLESLSSAMNIPSTSLEVSAIPSLDSSVLDSLTVPLTSSGGDGYGSSPYSRSSVSTTYNDHNHYHEPITINAKDMSLNEFKSTLISVLEEGKHRYTPP